MSREERFDAFVRDHRDRARGLATRLVGGDVAAAEDVVQDALLRAWRSLDGFRDDAALGTWFYKILVRQAANNRRWRGLRRFWMDPDADPNQAFVDANLTDPLLRQRIFDAIEKLPRAQREAFVLAHLEDFGARRTAEILGKPEGTVKSHLARALVTLREALAPALETNS